MMKKIIKNSQINFITFIILVTFVLSPINLSYSQLATLEFTISTDKTNYLLGEPVPVELKLKNISPDVVETNLFPPYELGLIKIIVTDSDGEVTEYMSEKMTVGATALFELPLITLNPGESSTVIEFLSFDLLTGNLVFPIPGNYVIQAFLMAEEEILESNIVNINVMAVSGTDADALVFLGDNNLLKFLTPEIEFASESFDQNLINKANEFLDEFPTNVYQGFVQNGLDSIPEPSEDCPTGTIGIFPICFPIIVGGELIPLNSTSLLLAGTYSTAAWMIPVIVSAIGIGIVLARKF